MVFLMHKNDARVFFSDGSDRDGFYIDVVEDSGHVERWALCCSIHHAEMIADQLVEEYANWGHGVAILIIPLRCHEVPRSLSNYTAFWNCEHPISKEGV